MTTPRAKHYSPALATAGLLLTLALTGCLQPRHASVAVWVVGEDDALTHDSVPSAENEIYSATRGLVHLAAALNETVAFQIGFRTTAPPAGPYAVTVSDFAGPTDTLPSATAVTLYRVHYTRVDQFRSWYPGHSGQPAEPTLFPDALVPWHAPRGGGPLILSEPRNEIVWVDVHVPPTLAPGRYRARLNVQHTATRATALACEIRLDVLPVALPGQRSLPVVCRVDPRDLLTSHLRWPAMPAEQVALLPDSPSHFAAVRLVNATMALLHDHRTTPILWAAFPKFRAVGDRTVEIDWTAYDKLVTGWLDGTAFDDRVPLEVWPLPVSLDYPNATRNGGFDSPRYARLLASYLDACQQHFAARGWYDRSILRLCPPEPLSQPTVDRLRRLSGIVRQSETSPRFVAHVPPSSLRGFGWRDAPTIEIPDVSIWAPSAMWFEPEQMARERKLTRQTWFIPDEPPYSGSLAVEAPVNDARILPWQAYRYGLDALWIENASQSTASLPPTSTERPWSTAPLVYPAAEFGLREAGPIPSVRLKRLRRGLQDYELLRLLEANGEKLLAQRLAEQVVRWAGTDACNENLLATKETGWPQQPTDLRLARILILRELVSTFEPDPAARASQIASLSKWGLMLNQAGRVAAAVDGVRLTQHPDGLRAQVLTSVSNATARTVVGRWLVPDPPPEWTQLAELPINVAPGARRSGCFEVALTALAYNTEGIYPFNVQLDTDDLGVFTREARLAVAACPRTTTPPCIDGQLDDWPLATNNAAGDFRLCRSPALATAQPALPTAAFFQMDDQHLYISVRCALQAGEPPLWRADNTVPVDGMIPWGQDVVEILLDPRPSADGTSSDLYCLQVKPTGLLLARHGCLTDPAMGTSVPWPCAARAAVQVDRDAWTLELAIPLDAFAPAARRNNVWGFNVTRLDARRGEYSSWSGAHNHCYAPQSLGNLIMLWP